MIAYKELTEKQQKRYERILIQAEELIYEQGFYKLSLEEITRHLKISRSTIYENFGSKEGLVEKIVDRFNDRLDEGLNSVVQDYRLKTIDKFIAIAQNQGEIISGHKLLNDLKIHLPHLYQKYEEGRKRREENGYKVIIEQGIIEGLFDPNLPPDFILTTLSKNGTTSL